MVIKKRYKLTLFCTRVNISTLRITVLLSFFLYFFFFCYNIRLQTTTRIMRISLEAPEREITQTSINVKIKQEEIVRGYRMTEERLI